MKDLYQEVFKAIDDWKREPGYPAKSMSSMLTLPESHWMLKLLDHLRVNWKLLESLFGN